MKILFKNKHLSEGLIYFKTQTSPISRLTLRGSSEKPTWLCSVWPPQSLVIGPSHNRLHPFSQECLCVPTFTCTWIGDHVFVCHLYKPLEEVRVCKICANEIGEVFILNLIMRCLNLLLYAFLLCTNNYLFKLY